MGSGGKWKVESGEWKDESGMFCSAKNGGGYFDMRSGISNKTGTGASVLGEVLGGVEGEAGDFGALGEEADVVGVDVGEVVRDFVVD